MISTKVFFMQEEYLEKLSDLENLTGMITRKANSSGKSYR